MSKNEETELALPPCFRIQGGQLSLSVKLQPRASKEGIDGIQGGELKVRVTAPPVDSAANEALVRLLASRLGCARHQVQLARGKTSRHKQLFLMGVDPRKAAASLIGEK